MINGFLGGLIGGSMLFFAATPSSTNYNLRSYDFGSGGTEDSSSANFQVEGSAGTLNGDPASSTNFRLRSGETPVQGASVVAKPTLTNPDAYYDRLRLVLNNSPNPSDTRYLIAISSDGFTTTRYVQTDTSIGASYTITNYQTYAAWGGASGFYITGLAQGTTYEVRVRALQGAFSESAFSPISDAVATVTPSLSFGVSTTLSGTPPFQVGFSSLAANTVYAGDADGTITLSSNAKLGGTVYVRSQNAGLISSLASSTITSGTADLSSVATGYGAQVVTATQTVGGPFAGVVPFNGALNNVGILSLSLQPLLNSNVPVFGGSATVRFKAKTSATTPSASDYTDTITLLAAMNY